jgi:hypothetical protein
MENEQATESLEAAVVVVADNSHHPQLPPIVNQENNTPTTLDIIHAESATQIQSHDDDGICKVPGNADGKIITITTTTNGLHEKEEDLAPVADPRCHPTTVDGSDDGDGTHGKEEKTSTTATFVTVGEDDLLRTTTTSPQPLHESPPREDLFVQIQPPPNQDLDDEKGAIASRSDLPMTPPVDMAFSDDETTENVPVHSQPLLEDDAMNYSKCVTNESTTIPGSLHSKDVKGGAHNNPEFVGDVDETSKPALILVDGQGFPLEKMTSHTVQDTTQTDLQVPTDPHFDKTDTAQKNQSQQAQDTIEEKNEIPKQTDCVLEIETTKNDHHEPETISESLAVPKPSVKKGKIQDEIVDTRKTSKAVEIDSPSKHEKKFTTPTRLPRVATLAPALPPRHCHMMMSKEKLDLRECQKQFKAKPAPSFGNPILYPVRDYMRPTVSSLAKSRQQIARSPTNAQTKSHAEAAARVLTKSRPSAPSGVPSNAPNPPPPVKTVKRTERNREIEDGMVKDEHDDTLDEILGSVPLSTEKSSPDSVIFNLHATTQQQDHIINRCDEMAEISTPVKPSQLNFENSMNI